MRINVLFVLNISALVLLAGCRPAIKGQPQWAQQPVSVIHATANATQIYLTDYFPTLETADSITASEGLSIQQESGWDIFLLQASTNEIGTLQVWKNGKNARIVVVPENRQQTNKPLIYAEKPFRGNEAVTIGYTQQPDKIIVLWQNQLLPDKCIQTTATGMNITLPRKIRHFKRSFIRVYASANGEMYNDMLIPLAYGHPVMDISQLTRHDKQAQVLYSLMIDRFQDGNTANDRKLNRSDVLPQVNYMGGDLKGITQQIEAGFFDSLGINTIWISPITQNPDDAWGQYHNPETKFSGYHGYWPVYITKIDDRFGTDDELKEMLATAHKHNINVILDYVANHLHINSPILQQHPDWITDSITPDGRRNFELWDEYRLTTWFDVHIPSLDLAREDVCEPMTDSALFWVENFDFDGFRHDACKHIPLEYWRMLTHKMKTRFPDKDLWQIGETYGNPELIGSYVKSGMLDAQFDFNIYHTAIDVLGRPDRSMEDLARVITESGNAYGWHHTMGNISGNHDKARFISLAGGALSFDEDHKAAGWNRNITVGDTTIAYRKSLLLEALNMTIPGVPCIYQGDEYGQPGGNDPDNRRMMRFGGYNEQEQAHLAAVEKLIKTRRNSMPLLYGDYIPLYADKDVLCFARTYMGETVIVILNKSMETREITVSLPTGLSVNGNVDITVEIKPLDYSILE